MKVYLAARYSRHPEMRLIAHTFRAAGWLVTSRWIEGGHEAVAEAGETAPARLREQYALEDWVDLMAADLVVSFTEGSPAPGRNRGGRHVEFGAALAAGKACAVVGPRENVFHHLPVVQVYPDAEWLANDLLDFDAECLLEELARRAAERGAVSLNPDDIERMQARLREFEV